MTGKHTETPWKFVPEGTATFGFYESFMGGLMGPDGRYVCHFGDNETYYPAPGSPPSATDAAFIVRAVNAHEGLVEALERLVAKYGKYDDGTDKDWTEYADARAALSAAKE